MSSMTGTSLDALPAITPDEIRDRQRRAASAAAERGLAGLLVWARGGSQQDQYADVFWLSGFYNQFPTMQDGPSWSAHGCCALVLAVDGGSVLLADSTTYDESPIVADRFVAGASDLVAATVTVLADLPPGPVGVLGSQALAFGWHARLCAETGRELVAADDLGPRLRWTKSAAEQARLRAAGAIGSAAVDAIVAAAVPGATEAEAVAEGVRVIVAGGGAVYGMGVSSGPSAHTYGPSSPAPYDGRRRLVAGDMFRIDLYGSVDGYCFDFGRSRVVGARATPAQQAVLVAARDSVLAGVSAVRVGATLGDVARACGEAIAASEWARGGDRLPPGLAAWGHAVGVGLEPPWIVATCTDRIEPGMCLAVERRIVDPGVGGSTYEENLLVTESGIELLSTSRSWIDD